MMSAMITISAITPIATPTQIHTFLDDPLEDVLLLELVVVELGSPTVKAYLELVTLADVLFRLLTAESTMPTDATAIAGSVGKAPVA